MLTIPQTETDSIQTAVELETPVSDVEAREHGRLISHLKDVALPYAAEAAEAAEVAEAVEGISAAKLPKSIATTIAMIREGMAVRPKSKTEAAVKEAGLERLRAHLHAISQGLPAPRVNFAECLKRTPPASAVAYFEALGSKAKNRKA
jgi:hypothetical protein